MNKFFVACDQEHRDTDFNAYEYMLVGKSPLKPNQETRINICWSKLWEFEDRIPWHCNSLGARLPLWLFEKNDIDLYCNVLTATTIAKPVKSEFVRSSKICTYTLHESLDKQLVLGYRFYENAMYFPTPPALANTLVEWAIENKRFIRYTEKSRKGPLKQNNKNNVISIQTNIS